MAALRRLSGIFGVVNNFHHLKPITAVFNNNLCLTVGKPNQFQQLRKYKTFVPWIRDKQENNTEQTEVPEENEQEEALSNEILKTINDQLETNTASRLFAVVSICGKQFKVTENDLLIVQGYWHPNPGDKLKLEKVLLVGGTDFTLVGQPILNRELVNIDATVVEKTFSHTKIQFRFKKRKQYRRIKFLRVQLTMLRINSIDVKAPIHVKKEVEGLDRIY